MSGGYIKSSAPMQWDRTDMEFTVWTLFNSATRQAVRNHIAYSKGTQKYTGLEISKMEEAVNTCRD